MPDGQVGSLFSTYRPLAGLTIYRAPMEESRKWGSYYIANLLLKTYFRLNSSSLSKNILNSLRAGRGDMPDFSAFPKSQQVTFKYHQGVLAFLEENYAEVICHC